METDLKKQTSIVGRLSEARIQDDVDTQVTIYGVIADELEVPVSERSPQAVTNR